MSDRPTIHKAIPLPCYPHQVEAAVAELKLTWATEHGDRRSSTIFDGAFAETNGVRKLHLIVTMREL